MWLFDRELSRIAAARLASPDGKTGNVDLSLSKLLPGMMDGRREKER